MARPTKRITRNAIKNETYDEAAGAMLSHDYYTAVALGLIKDASAVLKFGHNPDIDTGTDPEDVWMGGGKYTFISTATALIIASDNVNDTSAGTGARVVSLELLDGDYNPTTVAVTLNGQSSVTVSGGTYLRCNRIRVTSAGSGGENAGFIDLGFGSNTSGSLANLLGIVGVGDNQSHQAYYTVPVDKNAYIICWGFSMNSASGASDRDAVMSLRIRPFGETFQTKRWTGFTSSGSNPYTHMFGLPQKVEAKSDIVIRCEEVSTDNTDLSAHFDMVQVNA